MKIKDLLTLPVMSRIEWNEVEGFTLLIRLKKKDPDEDETSSGHLSVRDILMLANTHSLSMGWG